MGYLVLSEADAAELQYAKERLAAARRNWIAAMHDSVRAFQDVNEARRTVDALIHRHKERDYHGRR